MEPSPSFLGARSFIIIFCIARRWVLSRDSYIRTLTAQLFKFYFVIVPSTYVFPSSLFPLHFQTNVHICFSSPCVLGLHAPPTLAFITLVIHNEEYKLWILSLCSFPHFYLAISLFGPSIIFITLLANTRYLYYSLKDNLDWGTWLQISAWSHNSNKKSQSKYVLVNAMKACGEDKCIAQLILNCGTEVSGQIYAPAVLPPGKESLAFVE
jgi:hypothetical protein